MLRVDWHDEATNKKKRKKIPLSNSMHRFTNSFAGSYVSSQILLRRSKNILQILLFIERWKLKKISVQSETKLLASFANNKLISRLCNNWHERARIMVERFHWDTLRWNILQYPFLQRKNGNLARAEWIEYSTLLIQWTIIILTAELFLI